MKKFEEQPELGGRDYAHKAVDFLWDKVRISTGAAILIFISFCFIVAIIKSNSDSFNQIRQFQASVCRIVKGADKSTAATRLRIRQGAQRDLQTAAIDRGIASSLAKLHNPALKSIERGELNLARLNQQSANDLLSQAKQIRAIQIVGC